MEIQAAYTGIDAWFIFLSGIGMTIADSGLVWNIFSCISKNQMLILFLDLYVNHEIIKVFASTACNIPNSDL